MRAGSSSMILNNTQIWEALRLYVVNRFEIYIWSIGLPEQSVPCMEVYDVAWPGLTWQDLSGRSTSWRGKEITHMTNTRYLINYPTKTMEGFALFNVENFNLPCLDLFRALVYQTTCYALWLAKKISISLA